MRIVQVAPGYLPVPPKKYGGIEKVIYDLTEELVRRGHEVFLYAKAGSESSATIIPYPHHCDIAEYVKSTLPEGIDIIHDHTHVSIIAGKKLPIPTVCTSHCPWNTGARNLVYVSEAMRRHYGESKDFYVYNGINPSEYQFRAQKEDYLLFLGGLSKAKGVHHAIQVAERTGQKLKIAGPVHEREYFQKEIEPYIKQNPAIHYVGEVGGQDKQDLLKMARAMLFPSIWDEPFGLVMVEAMACGTPVVALNHGAVLEVMKGFPQLICRSVDEMVKIVSSMEPPSPEKLRQYVIDQFSSTRMTDQYLDVYQKVIDKERFMHRGGAS